MAKPVLKWCIVEGMHDSRPVTEITFLELSCTFLDVTWDSPCSLEGAAFQTEIMSEINVLNIVLPICSSCNHYKGHV